MDGRDYLADLLGNVPEWQARALCAQTDPEAFFPEKGGSTRDAKRICARCEVKENCLQYALEHDERFGIWGGLSERERRKIKRQAREAARRRTERLMPVVVCLPAPMINPELEPQFALASEPMPVGSVLVDDLVEPRVAPERERIPVAA
nr:WhiB family transcriptional regulator [Glycomyces buryatensis]